MQCRMQSKKLTNFSNNIMACYLQIENISKSFGPKILFENIGFNINEGDKIALIAPNGTGKTSLLKILAGKDKSDSGGQIKFLKDIRIAFLEQEYDFDPEKGILEQIMSSSTEFTANPDQAQLFEYEIRVKQFLSSFGFENHRKQMKLLSGGEIKRVALSQMLASEADFFIMDEPTNHLDIYAIEFLENYFKHSRCTLLMVTHDRYFLDRVCNTVIEIDHGAVYTYRGDYENYLERRQERIENHNTETDKVRNILRRELEWIRSTPCARSGKAKYRKEAFYELKDRAEQVYISHNIDMSEMGSGSRLGTKIINCKSLGFRYGDKVLLKDFTYNFQRYERVGIVGKNGTGKSTFLNILTGSENIRDGIMTGSIERGESLNIGYYNQSGIQFDEGQTVIETVNDTKLLNMFLFTHDMLNNKIETLSGGEKRRLYLLTILIQNPNLLILDEPTNDLDIVTLNILEEYLLSYKGSLIIVSHDRHFLDRLADHLLVFLGDGEIKDFIGKFSEYREYIKVYEARLKENETKNKPVVSRQEKKSKSKRKLSYKQQHELEQIEKEMEEISKEKAELADKMNDTSLPYDKLQELSSRYGEISAALDEMELRWLELSEI